MVTANQSSTEREKEIWEALKQVADPEIPVLSLIDLGMISAVIAEEEKTSVFMMPTFVGCPALEVMRKSIINKIKESISGPVEVIIDKENTWTSDLITEEGKEKLKQFGIAAPKSKSGCAVSIDDLKNIACPHCGSEDTTLRSPFGSTLCRAIHYCNSCLQSFEQFKPVSHG